MPSSSPRSRWSWKLFRVAGIDVAVHATFFLLLFYFLLSSSLLLVLLVLAGFACVLLHELGHALVARTFGIQTRQIILLPIGGVAQLERMPTRPLHELTIALAGPAVNVLLALLLLGIDLFLFGTRPFDPEEIFTNAEWLDASAEHVVRQLFVINVGLFAFNLLPAFPMDGGRALRALLAMRLSYVRATRWAARLGQALALAMGLAALLYLHSPILVLVAAFVFLSAGAEAAVVERKTYYKDRRAEAAMLSRFETVSPEDPLWKAVELLGAGAQTDFPVVRENAVLGVLHREELVRGLARRGLAASVADIGWREVPAVEADSSLEESYELLESQSLRTVPVVRNGELVGLLSRDKLVEYASIQRALEPKT